MLPAAPARVLFWSLTLAGFLLGPLHAGTQSAAGADDQPGDVATSAGPTVPDARPPANMRDPGPDLGGDFPNSAGTVPPGRLYLETGIDGQSTSDPQTDTLMAGFLLRTGIAPKFEFRFSGILLNIVDQTGDETTGAGPVALGFKYNIKTPELGSSGVAVGLEFQAELPIASAGFDDGVILPSGSINVDHTLPAGFSFHWNLGFATDTDAQGDRFAQANLQWSIARDVSGDFSLYLTGSVLAPATEPEGGRNSVAGGGFLWYPNDRTGVQLTLAAGLTDQSPDWCATFTAAFAF